MALLDPNCSLMKVTFGQYFTDLKIAKNVGSSGSRSEPAVGLGLLLHNPKAQAHAGLYFWAKLTGQTPSLPTRPGPQKPEPDPSPHFTGPIRPYKNGPVPT
jgi:hypothetical protein